MKCPACTTELSPVRAGSVLVDACLGGCGGIWFDQFELQKLDEPGEQAGELLVNLKRREEEAPVDYTQRRNCPRCVDIVLMRHYYSPRRRVEVDECPNCGGFWLDAGELALIREEHESEQEQQIAVAKYLEAASVSILGPMRSADVETTARVRRIEQLIRFSRPIRFKHD